MTLMEQDVVCPQPDLMTQPHRPSEDCMKLLYKLIAVKKEPANSLPHGVSSYCRKASEAMDAGKRWCPSCRKMAVLGEPSPGGRRACTLPTLGSELRPSY